MNADTSRHPVEELAEEFVTRFRRGERPAVSEYAARYPDWADEIRDVFPALLLMEEGRPASSQGSDTPPGNAEPAAVSPRLGDFRIVREIGCGGMGVVYEAVQESLGRRVALKVLPANLAVDPVLRERFQREAQAAARLHHTNIVPVFGVGTEGGVPYFAMQLIEGPGLAHVLHGLRRESSPPGVDHCRRVARLGVQAAEALAHAHSQGLIHRDVKPSNLLLDRQETLWVTDFGLAKAEGHDALTETGDLVGTLRYLAPERFHRSADARSDQYSLGLTLYELLTLRPAFDSDERGPLVREVMQGEVIPPRRLNPVIPRDLETILLTCLRREPERRYGSAAALAEDLRRFLEDRPILARRVRPLERAWRWCRRNPVPAALSAAVLVTLLTLLAVSFRYNALLADALHDAEAERGAATRNAEDARRAEEKALENLHKADEAVERMLTRVGSLKLRGVPQAEKVRRELLRDSLGFYEGFLAEYGADPRLRLRSANVHRHVGDAHRLLGDQKEAEEAYRRAIERFDALAADLPDSTERRAGLAEALNQQGSLLNDTGRRVEAETRFRRSLALYGALVEADPEKADYRYYLTQVANNQGNVLYYTKRLPDALRAFERALEEARRLTAASPKRPEFLELHGTVSINLASVLEDIGQRAGAETRLREGLEVARKAHQIRPKDPHSRQQVAVTCCKLGVALHARNDLPGAAETLQEAITLYEGLVADFPSTPDYAFEFGGALHNLALVTSDRGDWSTTRQMTEQAARWQQAALKISPKQVAYRRYLRNHWWLLSEALVRLGEHAESSRVVDQFVQLRCEPARDAYSAAQILGLCVTRAEADERQPLAERQELARAYADRALTHLRASLRAGYPGARKLESDPFFRPLHSRPDFQELVRELSKKTP